MTGGARAPVIVMISVNYVCESHRCFLGVELPDTARATWTRMNVVAHQRESFRSRRKETRHQSCVGLHRGDSAFQFLNARLPALDLFPHPIGICGQPPASEIIMSRREDGLDHV